MAAPPTSTGSAGAHVVHGSHDRPHRTIVVSRGHRDGHRQRSLHLGDGTAERCLRDIGTEIDDLEATAAQDVRSHGGREPVQFVRRSSEDHAAALGPPRREAGSQPGHDPRGHARSPMLIVDGVVTGLPAVADRSHGLAQPVQQDLVGIGPRAQAALDDRPGPRLVTGDEPILQPARRRCPRGPSGLGARAARHRAPRSGSREVAGVDPPLRPDPPSPVGDPSARSGRPSCSARQAGLRPPATRAGRQRSIRREPGRSPFTGKC